MSETELNVLVYKIVDVERLIGESNANQLDNVALVCEQLRLLTYELRECKTCLQTIAQTLQTNASETKRKEAFATNFQTDAVSFNGLGQLLEISKLNRESLERKLPMNKFYKFALIVLAGQLQGFATLFRKKNRTVADWLNWAGRAIQDVLADNTVQTPPVLNDQYNSPIPDNWKERFQIAAVQASSLAFAIRNYDEDFDGIDDKVATVLEKIATTLDALAN